MYQLSFLKNPFIIKREIFSILLLLFFCFVYYFFHHFYVLLLSLVCFFILSLFKISKIKLKKYIITYFQHHFHHFCSFSFLGQRNFFVRFLVFFLLFLWKYLNHVKLLQNFFEKIEICVV